MSRKSGNLRNIGLAMVPPDAIWTTWDDDDYRAPIYLSVMQKEMAKHDAHVLTFTERIEFNANTGYVWQMTEFTNTTFINVNRICNKR